MSSRPEPGGWSVELVFGADVPGTEPLAPFEAALAAADEASGAALAVIRDEKTGEWRVTAVLPARPDRERLEARLAVAAALAGFAPLRVTLAPLPALDWVAEVNRRTPPVSVGPFYVRGSHVVTPAPPGACDIVLDAGPAFGSGSHETTRGCLLAIARGGRPPGEGPLLDLGTGSGILAIAMAKRWRRPVIAADNDPAAVATAAENAARNGVGDLVRTVLSQGFRNPALRAPGGYGLIMANILARPLIGLAPSLARRLAAGGRAVLSGILAGQDGAVAAAYARQGLSIVDRIVVGEWPTLVVGR